MNRDNKYLFTIRSLTGGGAERVVSVLASNMAEDGYDVSIILYDKSDHDYPISSKVKRFYMPEAKSGILGKIGRIGDMYRLIKEVNPDVIIPFVGTVLFVSYFASRPLRVPFIRTIRNTPWVEEGYGITKIMKKWLNRRSVAIMVQNDEQIPYFPEKQRSKVFVVPNPVSEEILMVKKENYSGQLRRFISVGRLDHQKNQELLIGAFAQVHRRFSDTRLEIYGTGTDFDPLNKLIADLRIEGACFLMGRNDMIEQTMEKSDGFVLTSKFEGMPNALMEAMAVGLPCISSDCPTGPKTLIDHEKNGLLFSEGDLSDLVEKWTWLLQNPQKAEQMGRNASQSIRKKYTYKEVYSDLLNMLSNI